MTTDIQASKTALLKAIKAYGAGDMEPLLALAHDDIAWTMHAMKGHFRFGGEHGGRASMIAVLSMIAADYAISDYQVREMTAEGDTIWAASNLVLTHRRSGNAMNVKLVNRWRFKDGKIIDCEEYFDTAGAMVQEGRVPETIPREATV